MQAALALALLVFTAATPSTEAAQALIERGSASPGRTITQVVNVLQSLLAKARAEGEAERDLYAKYKCYCAANEESKQSEVAELTQVIAVLGSNIEELEGSSSVLSAEVAKLDTDMSANAASRQTATSIRNQENTAFSALQSDLTSAVSQLAQAITMLSEIGADQSFNTAADHTQYMANHIGSLAKLKSTVKEALLAASAFVSKKQARSVQAFLQAPFTGTYAAQAGEVVGILRDIRATFLANLASANVTESTTRAAYNAYMDTMLHAHAEMQKAFSEKQGTLSGNDADLATKKLQLQDATTQQSQANDFLTRLLAMCAAKKKQYNGRVALRSNEQVALSEAISILNTYAAFGTFGAVNATSMGPLSFLQSRVVRRHQETASPLKAATPAAASAERKAQAFLEKATSPQSSPLLKRIASLLQANNPFVVVLGEITKMVALISAEEAADAQQHQWCQNERAATTASLLEKGAQIITLDGEVEELTAEIEDPMTGLKVQIRNNEANLQANREDAMMQTADRKAENLGYQKDVANLVQAEALLSKAIAVLQIYYSHIHANSTIALLQTTEVQINPSPPATWDEKYVGQSVNGTGVINMLHFILGNSKAEEAQAHANEASSQHSFEDSIASLRTEERSLQRSLVDLKGALAEKAELLLEKHRDLAATIKEKSGHEAYLEKIRPGCDFITANLAMRQSNRVEEARALSNAADLLKQTPSYKEAVLQAHDEALKDCLDICSANEQHVHCKSCLAKVSVPGFCAGHPGTPGC